MLFRSIDDVRSTMPELPEARRDRFKAEFALSDYDASVLTRERATADYFEETLKIVGDAKLAANWVAGDVSAHLNKHERFFDTPPVTARQLGRLLQRIKDGTLSTKMAKDVFDVMCTMTGFVAAVSNGHAHSRPPAFENDDLADQIIKEKGLKQISDSGEIEKLVDDVLAKNAKQVEDYRAGREKAFNSLVGQVMKATQGKANPAQVNDILRRKLK